MFVVNIIHSPKYKCIFIVVDLFDCQFVFAIKLINCINVVLRYLGECYGGKRACSSTKIMPVFSISLTSLICHQLYLVLITPILSGAPVRDGNRAATGSLLNQFLWVIQKHVVYLACGFQNSRQIGTAR